MFTALVLSVLASLNLTPDSNRVRAMVPGVIAPIGDAVVVSQQTLNLTVFLQQLYIQRGPGADCYLQDVITSTENALTQSVATDMQAFAHLERPFVAEGNLVEACCFAPSAQPVSPRGVVVVLRVGCTLHFGYYDFAKKQSIYLGSRRDPNCVAI